MHLKLKMPFHRTSFWILSGISLILVSSIYMAHQSWSGSERLSFFIAVSPFIVMVWSLILIVIAGFKRYRFSALSSLTLCGLSTLMIWPIGWIFRSEVEVMEAPQVRLTTWNVERLGELDHSAHRRTRLKERLNCVATALEHMDTQLLVLQEISARRVDALEKRLGVQCEHVDYYGLGGSWRGGLATCARSNGPWEISRARDFSLGGDWKALFVEVKNRQEGHEMERFNVLNVHFSPHGVGTKDLKKVAKELASGSSDALIDLLQQVATNMKKQETQVEELIKVINTLHDPTLIAGDFNAPPSTSLHRAFARAGGGAWIDAWSEVGVNFGPTRYLGGRIPLRIDYIYALKQGFDLGSVRVSSQTCSDHQALHLRAQIKITQNAQNSEN